MTSLRSLSTLIVDDLATVVKFLQDSFETSKLTELDELFPFTGVTLEIKGGGTFLVCAKGDCNKQTLSVLRTLNATKYISIVAENLEAAKQRLIEVGGADTIQLAGGEQLEDAAVLLGGPEDLIFHLTGHSEDGQNLLEQTLIPDVLQHAGVSVKKGASKLIEVDKNPRPQFPSLDVRVKTKRTKSGWISCPPNSRKPIPFETDLFKGTALLLIRTDPVDSTYAKFFCGKRQFEVQVQGKFKHMPSGDIYVGAETTTKMELGIMTRAMAKTFLSFTSSMVNDLHYSFGDDQQSPDYQLPHLVAPIHNGMDRIVITPEGQECPKMGEPFAEWETAKERKIRVSGKTKMRVDTTSTYSFSVNTSNIDLAAWKFVGVPMVSNIGVTSMCGDTNIRLVAYEVPSNIKENFPNRHPIDRVNYVFNTLLTPLGPHNMEQVGQDSASEDGMWSDDEAEKQELVHSASFRDVDDEVMNNDRSSRNSEGSSLSERGGSLGGGGGTFSGDGMIAMRPRSSSIGASAAATTVSPSSSPPSSSTSRFAGMLGLMKSGLSRGGEKKEGPGEEKDKIVDRMGNFFKKHNPLSNEVDVPETPHICERDEGLEAYRDLDYCPAYVEVVDPQREGRRMVLYMLVGRQESEGDERPSLKARLRTYAEVANVLPLLPLSRQYKNKKLAIKEKKRRQLVETYEAIWLNRKTSSQNEWRALSGLLSTQGAADRAFLGGSEAVLKIRGSEGVISWEGSVAHATSNRTWSEEHLYVNKDELSVHLKHNTLRTGAVLKVPMNSIIAVRALTKAEVPMPYFKFFQVETFVRVYYFMVARSTQLADWLEAFDTLMPGIVQTEKSLPKALSTYNDLIEPERPYNARPSCWKLDKAVRVLNYRRIIFRVPKPADTTSADANETVVDASVDGAAAATESAASPKPSRRRSNIVDLVEMCSVMGPCHVVELLLKQALELSASKGRADPSLWINFMDTLSYLQILSLDGLSEAERVALLLNLYHIMVLHGNIVFGPPQSKSNWMNFFTRVSYVIGYDIVSSNELEHNVLRAGMSRPQNIASKMGNNLGITSGGGNSGSSTGSSSANVFPGLALERGDFRFNFCINSGSMSMPAVVPIYTADNLDTQLDQATTLMLRSHVMVDASKRSVMLPRVCNLYLSDFSPKNTTANAKDCLRVIVYYLAEPQKSELMRMLTEEGKGHITVRFHKMFYRGSGFSLMRDTPSGEAQD